MLLQHGAHAGAFVSGLYLCVCEFPVLRSCVVDANYPEY